MFKNKNNIELSLDEQPQLLVVVDTEEEFNWSAEPRRNANAVTAMQHIDRSQSICEEYGLSPCYVSDYPVLSQSDGLEPLKDIFSRGKCEIGVHLHPWVTPPMDEELTRSNMYPGNLPYQLEYQKIEAVKQLIIDQFDYSPTTYKAGRYGFGKNTAKILKELGFSIDLSVCPPVDYRSDGGPDYSDFSAEPFWFDDDLIEIPVTGGFVGAAGNASKTLYNASQSLKKLKMPGILSRLGIVDRLMLSPEGFTTEEHIKLTKFLYDKGVRTFTWSFHSTSVEPGMAPYVNTKQELAKFLDSFNRYFDFFFNELGGVATTPQQLKKQLES